LKLHVIKGYVESIYLVEYNEGLMLLDGACRPDVSVICDFIQVTLNRNLQDLKVVVVTHVHPDHAGAAHKLRDKTGCLIVTGENEGNWYKGLWGFVMYLTDMCLVQYLALRVTKKIKNVYYPRFLDADIYLSDLQSVPYFPEWKVLKSPGHTDCDLSLWYEKSGLMYVADNILRVGEKFISPFPVYYPDHYISTLNRYIELDVDNYLLAHGGRVTVSAEQIKSIINKVPKLGVTHFGELRRLFDTYIKKRIYR
jgi:glyoxylase-like metal-dependent hydrolase (beta-lactamase superfamily II)